ncbi:zinc finger C2HC domain-containing protein 1A-like [Anneissia japonica]|uniref:zinc finger C2HC domain-containing protein 1A-like n=1 Tax=Anneissia japonica TaxID=1529436 RepID=UPI0014256F2E|nr:zinc finger C2HC domain-containing protein 1A-like [Anneissia japonica]
MDFEAFSGGSTNDLRSCPSCGRSFNPESLQKHERICRKLQGKTRKVFNSGKQRARDSDVPMDKIIKSKPVEKKKTNPIKMTNWREKHLDFINSIRSARQVDRALKTGGPLPPPPPPSINPDYIQCPHCSRRFNQKAGERHIPFCATRSKTYGSPVKPLNKSAGADVGYSSTGIRKSYDSSVVRRKPNVGSSNYGLNYEDQHFAAMQERSRTNIGFRDNTFNNKPTNRYNPPVNQRFGQGNRRAKSAKFNQRVRFADNADADDNNNRNSFKAPVHGHSYPSHGPPAYSAIGSGDDRSRYGSQGSYRTTKASQLRSMSRNGQNRLGDASTVDGQNPSYETTTSLDLNGGRNGAMTSTSPRGRSPRSKSNPKLLQPQMPNGISLSPRPPTSPRGQHSGGHEVPGSYSSPSTLASVDGSTGTPAPFCYSCGTMYPMMDARFCCGCGQKRAYLTPI